MRKPAFSSTSMPVIFAVAVAALFVPAKADALTFTKWNGAAKCGGTSGWPNGTSACPVPTHGIYPGNRTRETTSVVRNTFLVQYQGTGTPVLKFFALSNANGSNYDVWHYDDSTVSWAAFTTTDDPLSLSFDTYYPSDNVLFNIASNLNEYDCEASTGGNGGCYNQNFYDFTSLAAYKVTASSPTGFLFGTSSISTTTTGSGISHGQTVYQYNTQSSYPGSSCSGTNSSSSTCWTSLGWGADQVAVDTVNGESYFLDSSGNVWFGLPFYNNFFPYQFLYWTETKYATYVCTASQTFWGSSTSPAFVQIAGKNGDNVHNVYALGGAGTVWQYHACDSQHGWDVVDLNKTGFAYDITTDNYSSSNVSVWAVDGSGNVWYAH